MVPVELVVITLELLDVVTDSLVDGVEEVVVVLVVGTKLVVEVVVADGLVVVLVVGTKLVVEVVVADGLVEV